MRKLHKRVECEDGFSMSVQASGFSYCTPRKDSQKAYSEVEIGFPSEVEPMLKEYAEQWTKGDRCNATETVYGWVPARLVLDVIKKHGGMVGGALPPLDLGGER